MGTLVGNVWAGRGGAHYNQMITPFVYYNVQKGWYFMYVPTLTANWVGSANDRWIVPVGAGFGRVFKVGKQPVNARTQIFNNVLRPNGRQLGRCKLKLNLCSFKGEASSPCFNQLQISDAVRIRYAVKRLSLPSAGR